MHPLQIRRRTPPQIRRRTPPQIHRRRPPQIHRGQPYIDPSSETLCRSVAVAATLDRPYTINSAKVDSAGAFPFLLPLLQACTLPPKNVRGNNRGIALNKQYRQTGKVKICIPEGMNRPMGANCGMLSREIGNVVRQCAPLKVRGWTEISNDDKTFIIDRVKEKFDLQWDLPYVVRCVHEIAQDCYKTFRHNLHEELKQAGGGEAARAAIPKDLEGRIEDWNWLCDYFVSEKFQVRAKAGIENRKKLKFVHTRGSQTFVAAQEKLEKMIAIQMETRVEGEPSMNDDQICAQVLGTRSGYVLGYGRGPKPPQREGILAGRRYVHLEEALITTKEKLAITKDELANTKNELANTKELVASQDKKLSLQDRKIEWLIENLMKGQQPPKDIEESVD